MTRTKLIPFLLLLATTASAQDGLVDVYELALINDPVIREAEASFLATSEGRAQARSALLPSLRLSGSESDSSSERDAPQNPVSGAPDPIISSYESDSSSSSLSLSLSQTVFDWGAFLSLQQADKSIARAETDLASIRQDLMLRVATAYFNVLSAEDLLAADIAAREALGQQLEQAEREFEVDLIPRTDVQEARAGYDQSVAAVIGSERLLASAQEGLREIVDSYITELRSPADELPLMRPDPDSVEAWVSQSQGQNLALISTRIAAEIAQDSIRISRSSRFPTLSLSASASDNSSSSQQTNNLIAGGANIGPNVEGSGQGNSISLNLNVPIFSGGANRSRIRQSVFQHRSALESVERVARQTERQTRDAYLGVISEISRVEALRQALESSQLALEATLAAEEVGLRTRVDVVNAQNNLRRAQTTYAASRYEYLLNLLRLKQAAGSLTEADLVEIDGWLE